MVDMLNQLGKDTLPENIIKDFVAWCVWTQAVPALIVILNKTGLDQDAAAISHIDDFKMLANQCEITGRNAHEARKSTGPLGLSTAEAAAFLMQKLAASAKEKESDADAIAFYAAQVVGWKGFADSAFSDQALKQKAEDDARIAQDQKLKALWDANQT